MSKKIELKEEIHQMNGLIGRMSFSIDDLSETQENGEVISQELLEEIQNSFEEIKQIWTTVKASL